MLDWLVNSVLLGVITVVYVLYSGLLADVTIVTGSPPVKKITFAYKVRRGHYRNCWKLFIETTKIGPHLPCLGVFYDELGKVPGPLCRYAVGSLLSEEDSETDEELLKRYETSGYKVFSFPEVSHMVTTTFPNRTLLSVFLRLCEVYPRLMSYIKEHELMTYPFIEIYRDNQIQIMAPLVRHHKLGVPEIRPAVRLAERVGLNRVTDARGADTNSEHSSGSGALPSDST